MIKLDPYYFSCDGHMLLDALALSAAFGTAFEMAEIRAYEKKNVGLRPHQRAAIELAGKLCGAEVSLKSTEVRFTPGPLKSGEFSVDIETAGPISSVLQAALIPAVLAPGPVTLKLHGGTDVLYRPNIGYVEMVLLPYYRMFADISLKVVHRGIFPRGEGKVVVQIENQRSPLEPDLQSTPEFEAFHLQAVGDSHQFEPMLERLREKLARPVQIERLRPELRGASLCLWAQADAGNWPRVLGSYRVADGLRPNFGVKLAAELLENRYDPRVELLSWLAGAPVPETTSEDSNELAASKYLMKTICQGDLPRVPR